MRLVCIGVSVSHSPLTSPVFCWRHIRNASLFVRNSLYVTPSLFFLTLVASDLYGHINTRTPPNVLFRPISGSSKLKIGVPEGNYAGRGCNHKRRKKSQSEQRVQGSTGGRKKGETNKNFVLLKRKYRTPPHPSPHPSLPFPLARCGRFSRNRVQNQGQRQRCCCFHRTAHSYIVLMPERVKSTEGNGE